MSTTVSAAQQLIGDTAPKLVELTDQVLFGDVWERPGLSPRDRSLITGRRTDDPLTGTSTALRPRGTGRPSLCEKALFTERRC